MGDGVGMIEFKRDGTRAIATIEVAVPFYDARVFYMSFECSSEAYAGLLTNLLKETVGEAVRLAREEAYEKGYKDAKAKRGKNKWFRERL